MLKVNQVCIYKYISEQQQFGTKQVRAGSYCWSYCRNSVQFKYVLALWLCSLIFIVKPIHLVGIYNESEATEYLTLLSSTAFVSTSGSRHVGHSVLLILSRRSRHCRHPLKVIVSEWWFLSALQFSSSTLISPLNGHSNISLSYSPLIRVVYTERWEPLPIP